MSFTQGGFGNAPVSKAITLVAGLGSVLAQASLKNSQATQPVFLRSLAHSTVFQTPGDLLFGSFLLYYFRVSERQLGSAKFGAFVCTAISVSWTLQQLASSLLQLPLPSGPYGLIFASFVQFFFNVPALSKFTVLGWKLSDKAFIYLAGLQLCLSGGVCSLAAAGSGLVAGMLYRSNIFGMRKWQIPSGITRALSSTIGRLLQSNQPDVFGGPSQRRQQAAQPQPGTGSTARRAGTSSTAARAANAATQAAQPTTPAAQVSQEALEQLEAMGFEKAQAKQALIATQNDIQAAIQLLV